MVGPGCSRSCPVIGRLGCNFPRRNLDITNDQSPPELHLNNQLSVSLVQECGQSDDVGNELCPGSPLVFCKSGEENDYNKKKPMNMASQ